MPERRAQFCFSVDCEFSILDKEGEEKQKTFNGGKYYWIESITKYPDGFSDIEFSSGETLFQIQLEEIGYYLGSPEIIESTESLEGEIKEIGS